jgi:hypothetical protein
MRLLSCTPVLFNTTTYGCKLAGFGNKQEDFYSLYMLPHAFEKAYYLDLREIPRPYIQYKTLFRGSDVIEAKQLSSEIDFMVAGEQGLGQISRKFYILRIPKFLNIDNFNISNDWENYIVANIKSYKSMSSNSSAIFNLDRNISNSEEYDYLLLGVIPAGFTYEETTEKILKFNIKKGHSVNKLCLRSELYAEI